jgi:type III restriction enzyme
LWHSRIREPLNNCHGEKRRDDAISYRVSATRIVIAETKGQEDLDVPLKVERLRQWCEDINRVQSNVTYDFVYVDEESFEKYKPTSFRQLVDGFREYKEKI